MLISHILLHQLIECNEDGDLQTGDTQSLNEEIAGQYDIVEADAAIISNFVVQLIIGGLLILLFLICRRRAPWVYYPNSEMRPNHPCHAFNGILNWIKPLMTLEDTKTLGMVGMDGFMLLQTMKLIYRIFFVLSLLFCPILCVAYFQHDKGSSKTTYFERLSIKNVKSPAIFYTCIILMYVTTLLIFYLIFIYYKRYVTLRQVYLVSPASLTSVETLKSLGKQLSSYEDSIDFVNMTSTTVIMDRLPSYLKNDRDVYNYISDLHIGEIENAILIQDTYKLTQLYEERDMILQNIEKYIATAFTKIQRYFEEQKDRCEESFKETYNKTLERSAIRIFRNMRFSLEEKVRLLNCFITNGGKFLSMAGPGVSYVKVYLESFKKCNQRIVNEKERLRKDKGPDAEIVLESFNKSSREDDTHNDSNSGEKETRSNQHEKKMYVEKNSQNDHSLSEIIEIPEAAKSVFIPSNLEDNVSFFSFTQLCQFKKYRRYFSLDIPVNKRRAFVTFADPKQAGIIKQAQIGTRVFSPKASSAPAPNDIVWKNITKSEISCFFGQLGSTFIFIGYNILFYFTVSSILRMLDLEEQGSNFLLSKIKNNSFLETLYNGMITPLIYNTCILVSPYIIEFLINMEGISSYSLSQMRLMKLYSIFLFYNAFLAIFLSTSFFRIAKNIILNKDYKLNEFVNELGSGFIRYSLFFFNTVVQRMIVGTIMVLLKPVPFFMNFILYPLTTFTRRQEDELKMSPPFDFGNVMPQVLLVFPIALSYGCICPVMLPLGFCFYFFSYFVYKNELIYTSCNPYESGGVFWIEMTVFLVMGVIAFQLATFATMISMKYTNVLYYVIPLFIIDLYFYQAIGTLFHKNCTNYPLNEPEEEFLDEFASRFIVERKKMLKEWDEKMEAVDEDKIPVSELGIHDRNLVTNTSYYKDPSMVVNISEIKLPYNFYLCIHFLRTFDYKNVFGFNKDVELEQEE
ncbi:early-responsive to dehydration stress protein [Nucleospora cyclopteri]